MSEPGSSCPSGLVQYDDIFDISLCWITGGTEKCDSTFFSTYGLNYTKVCGQMRGYQYGYPIGFHRYIINGTAFDKFDPQIKTWGVTLTYGNNPRKHIWTYAGGWNEQGKESGHCPCNNGSQYVNYTISFVGNDYYCESGTSSNFGYDLFLNDPLWDGEQLLLLLHVVNYICYIQ